MNTRFPGGPSPTPTASTSDPAVNAEPRPAESISESTNNPAKLRRDQITQRHETDNRCEGRNETDDYYDYLREIAEDNGQSFGDFMDSVWRD